jgi:hypothetical protein
MLSVIELCQLTGATSHVACDRRGRQRQTKGLCVRCVLNIHHAISRSPLPAVGECFTVAVDGGNLKADLVYVSTPSRGIDGRPANFEGSSPT